jgi:class 3 adenylate cyclase/predicted ATPase
VTFDEVLEQALEMLCRRGRVSYRALKVQFQLDDTLLEILKDEIVEVHQLARDQGGKMLVWTGDTASPSVPASSPGPDQGRAPLTYTPPYLAEKILTSRPALEGERKQVTVLFADIKDSTELIKDLDPEAAQQLLDPALRAMMEAVHRFEGTVNQVLGDGIMALFGAPLAHEDHALRACYAALTLQSAMREHTEAMRRAHGIELRIRVGLNSGEVVVRAIGNDLHMDYSAVGQTTHLAARIDRLPPEEKQLLQAAAVIGTEVPLPLLQAIAELPEAALHRGLTHLQAAEFLYETRLFPERAYTFKHALTQRVACQSLLTSTRQRYHAQLAEALEARPETVETQPELLAHHYTEAGLAAPAVGYWQRAGERSNARSAYVEAVVHLTKGLEILQTLPDTPARGQRELEMQLALGQALGVIKGSKAAEVGHAFARARELCDQVGDPLQLLRVLGGLGRFFSQRGEFQTARELMEQNLALAQRQHDAARLIEAHADMGLLLHSLGEYVPARVHLEQALALAGPRQDRALTLRAGEDRRVTCLGYMARVLWVLGYPDQALTRSHEMLTYAQELSHTYSLSRALFHAAGLHRRRREWSSAQERAEVALDITTEQGFGHSIGVLTFDRGQALAAQGQGKAGIAQMHQGLATIGARGQGLGLSARLAQLAEAYGDSGQAEEGLRLLAEALAHVGHTGDRHWEAEVHRLKGELLLRQAVPDAPQAEACFQQALAVARRQQARSFELRAALSLSRLWQQQGKRAEARELLAPIYSWFTEGFDTPDLQEAKALLEALGT